MSASFRAVDRMYVDFRAGQSDVIRISGGKLQVEQNNDGIPGTKNSWLLTYFLFNKLITLSLLFQYCMSCFTETSQGLYENDQSKNGSGIRKP